MLNDTSSPLALLGTRRSARPRDLIEPGPDQAQLRDILTIAARTPDHGKLHPWRFLHVRSEDRAAFGGMLEAAYRRDRPEAGRLEIEAAHRFAAQAPALIVVLSSPVESVKAPRWEQELSCGAACMNLLLAAHAMGFAGGWVTGWATYSAAVLEGLGAGPADKVAGFIFLGTPAAELEERARPVLDDIVSNWVAPSYESP
jgi:nitroreductase